MNSNSRNNIKYLPSSVYSWYSIIYLIGLGCWSFWIITTTTFEYFDYTVCTDFTDSGICEELYIDLSSIYLSGGLWVVIILTIIGMAKVKGLDSDIVTKRRLMNWAILGAPIAGIGTAIALFGVRREKIRIDQYSVTNKVLQFHNYLAIIIFIAWLTGIHVIVNENSFRHMDCSVSEQYLRCDDLYSDVGYELLSMWGPIAGIIMAVALVQINLHANDSNRASLVNWATWGMCLLGIGPIVSLIKLHRR